MTLFKAGDLVRRITEDGTGEIVRVVDHKDARDSMIIVSDDNVEKYEDPNDYELITDDQLIQESVLTKPVTTDRTFQEIHDDICKMFIQIAAFTEDVRNGDRLTLTIKAEHTNEDAIDVNFSACVRYGEDIVTNNLFKSAEIAVARHTENEGHKPLRLSMRK